MDQMLSELLASASGRLAAYGYLLTGSQHAAEDLVQDALVKVFVRRRRIPHVTAAESYVRAAMRTLHIDRMRRESAWRRVAPTLAGDEIQPDAAESVSTADAVARALAMLSPRQRTAVVLRYFDDLTVSAVATEMGLADGTVKRYLADALDRLAVEVGHDAFELDRVEVGEMEGRP